MPDVRITMAGRLPDTDELNGLTAVANEVVEDDSVRVVVVAVLGAAYIKHNVDTGEDVPQMRVMRIEPITRADDKVALGRIANRAHEARTGKTVLPLEMEQELADAFGRVDPDTGEILGGDA